MRKFAFKIAYIGLNYHGFERQNGTELKTVESEFFKAFYQTLLLLKND